jgi:hypothetical protein
MSAAARAGPGSDGTAGVRTTVVSRSPRVRARPSRRRPLEPLVPVSPGELIRIDIKKLGRFDRPRLPAHRRRGLPGHLPGWIRLRARRGRRHQSARLCRDPRRRERRHLRRVPFDGPAGGRWRQVQEQESVSGRVDVPRVPPVGSPGCRDQASVMRQLLSKVPSNGLGTIADNDAEANVRVSGNAQRRSTPRTSRPRSPGCLTSLNPTLAEVLCAWLRGTR